MVINPTLSRNTEPTNRAAFFTFPKHYNARRTFSLSNVPLQKKGKQDLQNWSSSQRIVTGSYLGPNTGKTQIDMFLPFLHCLRKKTGNEARNRVAALTPGSSK